MCRSKLYFLSAIVAILIIMYPADVSADMPSSFPSLEPLAQRYMSNILNQSNTTRGTFGALLAGTNRISSSLYRTYYALSSIGRLGYATNRQNVLENTISNYCGQITIRVPVPGFGGVSAGPVMGLGNANYNQSWINILMHENGHFQEYQELGFWRYFLGIGVPSLVNSLRYDRLRAANPGFVYAHQPWEIGAEVRGGVVDPNYPGNSQALQEAIERGERYFAHIESISGISGWWRFLRHELCF